MSEPLIQPPYDEVLDGTPTRRELQPAFRKVGVQLSELKSYADDRFDTQNIVLNFLCETLGVKREDIDKWVEKKQAEMAQQGAASEPPNG